MCDRARPSRYVPWHGRTNENQEDLPGRDASAPTVGRRLPSRPGIHPDPAPITNLCSPGLPIYRVGTITAELLASSPNSPRPGPPPLTHLPSHLASPITHVCTLQSSEICGALPVIPLAAHSYGLDSLAIDRSQFFIVSIRLLCIAYSSKH